MTCLGMLDRVYLRAKPRGVLSVEAAVLISVLFRWEAKAPGASAGGKAISVWRLRYRCLGGGGGGRGGGEMEVRRRR